MAQSQIVYSASILSKRPKGRPVLTVGCLKRQSNEPQRAFGIDLPALSSDDDDVLDKTPY